MRLIIFLTLLTPSISLAAESPEFANKVIQEHGLQGEAAQRLKNILTRNSSLTRNIGTEDPEVLKGPNNSWHPATRTECRMKVLDTGKIRQDQDYEKICSAKWMAPIPNSVGGDPRDTKVCVDQFEFPNIPCEYPVVWVPSATAKQICESMGKRLCNSHEWETACAGGKKNKDSYRFDLPSLRDRRSVINSTREKVWAFQWQNQLAHQKDTGGGLCGIFDRNDPDFSPQILGRIHEIYASNGKSASCHQGPSDFRSCGTNTWPSGMKHDCRSATNIYDLHGNVAEVVSFPTGPSELAQTLSVSSSGIAESVSAKTERKGSFFVVRDNKTYPDDCLVRQPYEHFKDVTTDTQHSYYQEGFRCCKDVVPQ